MGSGTNVEIMKILFLLFFFPPTCTDLPAIGLICLPQSFVELYSLVNRVKGWDNTGCVDEADGRSSSDAAICHLNGAVMHSGACPR
eukprot:11849506-Ditylum_brightwellii.AAC.1